MSAVFAHPEYARSRAVPRVSFLEILRSEKMQDAIGAGIGVLVTIAFGAYVVGPKAVIEPASAPCVSVPYTGEQRVGECYEVRP